MENIENSRKTPQNDEISNPEILLNPEETAMPKSIKTKIPHKANKASSRKENEKEKEKHKTIDVNASPKKEKPKTNATNKR